MKEKELFSPLMEKYHQTLRQNPKSRVFAPLAEIYRKHTMHEKALDILKRGIRYNPEYALGYLGLAECYYDKKQYSLAYSTLRPLVGSHRENIRMQKLFAGSCEKLKYLEEALDTYKHILLLNPKDNDTSKNIQTLEERFSYVEIHNQKNSELQKNNLFNIENLSGTPDSLIDIDIDCWEEVSTHSGEHLEPPSSLPNDKTSIKQSTVSQEDEEGRKGLMDAYDNTFSSSSNEKTPDNSSVVSKKEKALWHFYRALKKRSKQKYPN